jgi:hypothetical protein
MLLGLVPVACDRRYDENIETLRSLVRDAHRGDVAAVYGRFDTTAVWVRSKHGLWCAKSLASYVDATYSDDFVIEKQFYGSDRAGTPLQVLWISTGNGKNLIVFDFARRNNAWLIDRYTIRDSVHWDVVFDR